MNTKKLIEFLASDDSSKDIPKELRNRETEELVSRLEGKLDMIEKVNPEAKYEVWEGIQGVIKKERRIRLIRQVSTWAAVIMIPLFVTFLLLNKDVPVDNLNNISESFKPGEPKAVLLMADGKEYDLEKIGQGNIKEDERLKVLKDSSNTLVYEKEKLSEEKSVKKEKYNTVKVPKGGEYKLVLADGTKVWLNSETELRFPEIFYGEERRVYLKGEAYFDVTKDKKHPFRVMFNKGNVEVLGTQFSVTAFEDEEYVSSVLKEGSVRFSGKTKKGGRSVILKPGNMALMQEDISVSKVNIRHALAWMEGKFYFEDMRLEDIMKRLGRWYDFESFFLNKETKDLIFTGVASKHKSLDDILNKIEMTTDVKFRVKKNTIIVEKSR